MPTAMDPNPYQLRKKVRITGSLLFETAWRIGSGKEGETMSDLGVVRAPGGAPVLPGSSLKGKLRNTCEALAYALGLNACLLNATASAVKCVSDVNLYRDLRKQYEAACGEGLSSRLAWIESHTCGVCKLFGSPVQASRLKCSDGRLLNDETVVQVRDGVVLDRDSRTAVDGLKYDYEVVQPGTRFAARFDLDNPSDADLALLGAALFEWHAGGSLGGFTSRGLGRFKLEDIHVHEADLSNPKERLKYLTALKPEDRLTERTSWQNYFTTHINRYAG